MGKSFLKSAPEQKGIFPACSGALFKIKEIEKQKTKEKKYRMFMLVAEATKPASIKGMQMREWFVIGTEADPLAKEEETWNRSEGGPGRLARLLNKAEVEIDDEDDELWREAAVDHEFVAPVVHKADRETGEPRAQFGLFYNAADDDCPEIGTLDVEEAGKKGKKGEKKRKVVEEDEDDEKPAKASKTPKKPEPDDDEDEEPSPRKKGKATGKKAKKTDDDDDE